MKRLKLIVGSMAGTGFLPFAPGTWASLLTVGLLYLIVQSVGWTTPFVMCICGSLLTLWSASECESEWGEDPSRMTMDEFAGQSLVYLFIPFSGALISDLPILISGFILFRLFDIMKPLGIRQLQHLHSGFGILLDDILAGIYGCIILQIVHVFLFSA